MNIELLKRVRDHIAAHPDEYDYGWSGCIAGTTVKLVDGHLPDGTYTEGRDRRIRARATELLGVDDHGFGNTAGDGYRLYIDIGLHDGRYLLDQLDAFIAEHEADQ